MRKRLGEHEFTVEPGTSLDAVIRRLQAAKRLGWDECCEFNGVELHSSDCEEWYIYHKVYGCDKEEYERRKDPEYVRQLEERKRLEAERKALIERK